MVAFGFSLVMEVQNVAFSELPATSAMSMSSWLEASKRDLPRSFPPRMHSTSLLTARLNVTTYTDLIVSEMFAKSLH